MKLAFFLFSIILFVGCASNKKEKLIIPKLPKIYKNIEWNSFEESACSPKLNDDFDFEGIIIKAPKVVGFTDGNLFLIPLCGVAQYEMTKIKAGADYWVYMLDLKTKKKYKAKLYEKNSDDGFYEEEEPVQLDDSDLAGQIERSYFNTNLASYVELPKKEADYILRVKLGKFKSNKIKIKVRSR